MTTKESPVIAFLRRLRRVDLGPADLPPRRPAREIAIAARRRETEGRH